MMKLIKHFRRIRFFLTIILNYVNDLDKCINVWAIILVVRKSNIVKAHGRDMLLNEYFTECINILAPFICDFFQFSFQVVIQNKGITVS